MDRAMFRTRGIARRPITSSRRPSSEAVTFNRQSRKLPVRSGIANCSASVPHATAAQSSNAVPKLADGNVISASSANASTCPILRTHTPMKSTRKSTSSRAMLALNSCRSTASHGGQPTTVAAITNTAATNTNGNQRIL
jgi:hypothetical protein